MARLLRYSRVAVGVLTLGTAAPLAALEWGALSAERDALQGEVERLRADLERQQAMAAASRARGTAAATAYAGSPLLTVTGDDMAAASEERVQLTTEAAALRRELARTRAELGSWERPEGTLDLVVEPERGQARADDQLVDLMGQTEQLRRRVVRGDRDLEEVQVERDEALAQLRREMFSNLLYTAIIGECGHRNTPKAVEECANSVRDGLRPHWARFESCVRDYNAVPAYSQAASAQNVSNALRLARGAVLMCDPRLPEGGER